MLPVSSSCALTPLAMVPNAILLVGVVTAVALIVFYALLVRILHFAALVRGQLEVREIG